jgi:hypothetical protein
MLIIMHLCCYLPFIFMPLPLMLLSRFALCADGRPGQCAHLITCQPLCPAQCMQVLYTRKDLLCPET